MMMNYKVTDKYNQTCVVLGHTEEHAIERAYKMYLMKGISAVLIEEE